MKLKEVEQRKTQQSTAPFKGVKLTTSVMQAGDKFYQFHHYLDCLRK